MKLIGRVVWLQLDELVAKQLSSLDQVFHDAMAVLLFVIVLARIDVLCAVPEHRVYEAG